MRVPALLCLAIVLGITACKKTQEGELRNWDRNSLKARELASLYPGFSPAIQAQHALAQKAMTAARAVSNTEESARLMAEANTMLTGGFLGLLGDQDARLKKLREKIVAANAILPGNPESQALQATLADTQRVLFAVDETLRRGTPDPVGALAVLRKVDTDLNDTTRNLDRFLDAARKRQDATRPQGPNQAVTPAAPGAAATWKCAYCGSPQSGGAAKCSSCGAPRKPAKK